MCVIAVVAWSTPLVPAATTAPAATAPATRPVQEIRREMMALATRLHRQVLSQPVLNDPARRADAAATAIPLLRRHIALAEETARADPRAVVYGAYVRARSLALLVLLGDDQAKAEVEAATASGDRAEAQRGRAIQLLVRWFAAGEDEVARSRTLDEAARAASASPDNEPLARALQEIAGSARILTAQRDRARRIIAEHLEGPTANDVRDALEAPRRLARLAGQPLVIAGVRHDGTPFSTADLKGRVILIDFWATWCGPCVEEIPRVKQVYAKYHEKGLEVVGVSCDEEPADLANYLAKNPDMPWPQLFDAKRPGWHALAKEYGISGIPAMLLIDRRGVVRTTLARANFEQLIPELLAEPTP